MLFLSNRKLKLIIISLLLMIFCFILGIFNVKAESFAPNPLQYYSPDYYTSWTRSTHTHNLYGETFYNTNVETIREIGAFYGISNNQPLGNIISFTMLKGQPVPTISAKVQTVDGSFLNCSIDTKTDDYSSGTLYIATCDFGESGSQYIYKYGFQWSDSQGYNMSENSLYLSKINAFASKYEYNTYIQNINNAINSASQQAHQDAQNINNSINDSSVDTGNAINSNTEWNSKNATNGTITQLLTLPITLLQAIVNGLQTSCSSFSLGSLFGTNITLPCINVGNLIGSGLWTTIDILFSGFMIFSIAKKLIKIFNDFTNLKSNQIDELYGGGN